MSYEFRGPGIKKPDPRRRGSSPAPEQRPEPRREVAPGGETSRPRRGRSLVQLFAALLGLVFLLLGIGGFIPGVTENHDQLELYGTDSMAKVLDQFRVSIVHNIVHLVFAVGLLAAASAKASKLYLLGGGVVYLGAAAYGFLVDEASEANFLPTNDADNLLHVGLGVAMILLGLLGAAASKRGSRA